MAFATTRSQKRIGFTADTRIQLLEDDADEIETLAASRHTEIKEKLDTLNSRLFGVLSGLVVASVMLAVNAVVK